MNRCDDILDEVIDKARYAADVAGKKTTEMMEYGKLKYKAKTVTWDIGRAYSKLGVLVYEARKSGENYEETVALAVEELDRLNARLDELEEQLASLRANSVKEARTKTKEYRAAPEDEGGDIFTYSDED